MIRWICRSGYLRMGDVKMCIVPGCQTEMAHAVRGIFCLLHGPQGKPGEHGLLRRSRCPGEQLLDLLGMDLPVSDMKGVTEVVDQDRKPADLFLIGLSWVLYRNGICCQ